MRSWIDRPRDAAGKRSKVCSECPLPAKLGFRTCEFDPLALPTTHRHSFGYKKAPNLETLRFVCSLHLVKQFTYYTIQTFSVKASPPCLSVKVRLVTLLAILTASVAASLLQVSSSSGECSRGSDYCGSSLMDREGESLILFSGVVMSLVQDNTNSPHPSQPTFLLRTLIYFRLQENDKLIFQRNKV